MEPHHPDLFWYGIHPTEGLYTVMGPGCEKVTRVHTADADVVTGIWKGGRVGVLHGLRSRPMPHKVTVFGANGFAEQKSGGEDYAPLVREIMRFFETGVAPVAPDETLELYTFMEAADESKRQGGVPVMLSDVLHKAKTP